MILKYTRGDDQMPDEDFLGESLRKIAKGAGRISFMLIPASLFQSVAHNNPRLHHPAP